MAPRIKLALIFKYDESWVAGSYYILNLLHALKSLPPESQPHIILYSDRKEDQLKIEELSYPHISYKKYIPELNTFEKVINKFSRFISKKNWIEKRMTNADLDYVFIQRRSWETDLLSNSKKIFWIPDCQELLMPELFFKRELDGRKHVYNEIIEAKSKVLFSSNAALNDFKSFYPQAVNPMFVVNFAVVHPAFESIAIEELKLKYSIRTPYFIVPNQFWVHKNHKIVLEAALLLSKRNINCNIAFTGKENDFRAPEYTKELKKFVNDHQLNNTVHFLGFIPREEQLCLMKNSMAIIQPSLFEGWSTVVEDAKALNQWIILSDIKVHKEQMNKNVHFFNPKDAESLATLLEMHINQKFICEPLKYQKSLEQFGQSFYEMLIN